MVREWWLSAFTDMIVFSLRELLLDFFRHRLNLAPARLVAAIRTLFENCARAQLNLAPARLVAAIY